MPRPDTIEVSIQTLFGDEAEQGREIAKLDVSTYKHAGGNAARVFVRTCQPKAGRYMAVWQDHDGSAALIFEVKYPEAVIRTNGRDELVGGPYGWNRGNGTVLKMTDHYRRPAPPLDREMLEAAVPGVMAAVVMAHPCTSRPASTRSGTATSTTSATPATCPSPPWTRRARRSRGCPMPVPELRVAIIKPMRGISIDSLLDGRARDDEVYRVFHEEQSIRRRYKDLLSKAEAADEDRLARAMKELHDLQHPEEDPEQVKLLAGRVVREADRIQAVTLANTLAERMVESYEMATWRDD